MCGRYALKTSVPEMARALGVEPPADVVPRYNIAPTQMVPALHAAHGQRAIRWMRWGLVPSWSNGIDARYAMHNARVESLTSKPAFRKPINQQRCLIPCSGWYEWQKLGDRKQPWLIDDAHAPLICLAGLWDHWQNDGQSIVSCSIVTTSAIAPIDGVHHRMPVVVASEQWDTWLDPRIQDGAAALETVLPGTIETLRTTAVSSHVNNAKNDDPRCLEGF